METDSDDTWSVTSNEEESQNVTLLQSRAYQIEMFEASMKGNIIAVVRFIDVSAVGSTHPPSR